MNRTEFTAKTLDEAITKACVELGVISEDLDYEITEQGSNGILGIGARPWVIAACVKEAEEAVKALSDAVALEPMPDFNEKKPAKEKKAPVQKKEKKAEAKQEVKEEMPARTEPKPVPENMGELEKKAVEFLKGVFDSMDMNVDITAAYDELMGELYVNLTGDDMGVLIGKRGQTLDSLQYLTGQVINKHGRNYVRVKLDTENYRERRKEALETLAHNMASKVKRTRKPMVLEPMNPYERRIIHSALQDEKEVTTKSEGEEPYRHVVVVYVKKK